MNAPTSFLIRTSAIPGEATAFLIACDDSALRWLSESFLALGRVPGFTIGDGQPIYSDNRCIVDVTASAAQPEAGALPTGRNRFFWIVPRIQAEQFAALTTGMIDFPGACHQYLEGEQPNAPTFVVSKGEYNIETLRKMLDS